MSLKTTTERAFHAAFSRIISEGKRGLQAEIARKIGKEPPYINRIVSGDRPGTEDVRRSISSALGYTYEEMLSIGRRILDGQSEEGQRGATLPPFQARGGMGLIDHDCFVSVPKYKARPSGGHGTFDASDMIESNLMFRHDFLSKRGQVDQMALFEVTGNSMEPFIYEGDVVLVDRSSREITDGKAYAYREGDTIKIKRLSRQGNVVIASSENAMMYPAYRVETDNFSLIGRVIWVGHEVM